MTDAEFDTWMGEVRRTVAKLVGLLDRKPEEELSDTQIRDKHGVVHDLAELVKSKCVINTGIALHMAIHDFYTCINRWTSSGGASHSSESLASLIREHADDPDVEITVHKF